MRADPLFLAAGLASLAVAAFLALRRRGRPEGSWRGVVLWLGFGVGLLIQALAPPLQIQNRAFVMPQTPGGTIDPAAIVDRARWMQAISGLVTASSAVGLAYHYRSLFLSPRAHEAPAELRQ